MIPVSSKKSDCRLKWTESEMQLRAANAGKFRARFPEKRFPTALAEAKDSKTSRPRRRYIYEKIQNALTTIENKVGFRKEPVFKALGYFKYDSANTSAITTAVA